MGVHDGKVRGCGLGEEERVRDGKQFIGTILPISRTRVVSPPS